MDKHEQTTGKSSLVLRGTATDVAETASTESKEGAYTQEPASPSAQSNWIPALNRKAPHEEAAENLRKLKVKINAALGAEKYYKAQ